MVGFQPPGGGGHLSHEGHRTRPRSFTGGPSLTDQWATRLPEDPDDVILARQGDERAFERLYRANVGRIHGLARRMAGFDAADELTQDVFIRAWEKLGSFRGDSRFSTWLYRLAVNVIIERRRSAARRSWLEVPDGEAALGLEGAPAADTATAMDLRAAVDSLPEGARQIFLLHDVEGYKHHEIGKLLGIADGTSKGQLHRARMMLRSCLRGRKTPAADGSS
ncbi:MAG TPA: RNA polymerase sigma factor [Vicinamibacterales bacterium]|nr:RNA polymerase sigma factor [Vicinamibacterales bacterium]